ncbi:MAG: NosD domain-containing protein, partial [Thermoplasmata archaeon]
MRKATALLVTVGLAFIMLVPVILSLGVWGICNSNNDSYGVLEKENDTESLDNTQLRGSREDSSIFIEGDNNFTPYNGVSGGDGSPSNPYVISNNSTNASSSSYGIQIANTTKHYIIKNCTVISARGDNSLAGHASNIVLYNSTNGTIDNCLIGDSTMAGITLIYAKNITITNSSVLQNAGTGIKISNSYNITLIGNNILDLEHPIVPKGIDIKYSTNISVEKNNISYNFQDGIYVEASSIMFFSNNSIKEVRYGFNLINVSNSQIYNNTITNTGFFGGAGAAIKLDKSIVNISKNYIHNNFGSGIYMAFSNNSTIFNNALENNTYAIQPLNSENITIVFNAIRNNTYGIYSDGVGNLTNSNIYNNNLSSNSISILLKTSFNVNVSDNYFNNNNYSLIVNYSKTIYLFNNNFTSDKYNIRLFNNDDISIRRNTMINTANVSIYISTSRDVTIVNNDIMHGAQQNNLTAIYVVSSTSLITYNNKLLNCLYGIRYFPDNAMRCENTIIANNSISFCTNTAIHLLNSIRNIIINNTILNSSVGINLSLSNINWLLQNNISNCTAPLTLNNSTNNTLINNTFFNNKYGIILNSSSYNHFSYNTINRTTYYGVIINNSSSYNVIIYNNFINNTITQGRGITTLPQALDDGRKNIWYLENNMTGNYWDNWDNLSWGTPSAYPLAGSTGAYDKYPLNQTTLYNRSVYILANSTIGRIPLNVSFHCIALPPIRNITSCNWNFGDGTTSAVENTTHTYTSPGNYTVWLTISLTNGQSFSCNITIIVLPPLTPPQASFSANVFNGSAPLTVNFTSTSTDPDGTILSYRWNFGDGNTSTQQNATHTFTQPGNYDVKLTVIDDDGLSASYNRTITVQPPPNQPPHANFTANVTTGPAPLL